jgi:hypothetical protein
VTPVDVAAGLRALADRVRRNIPLNSDPERFHEEKSEIARGLIDIAEGVSPGGRRASVPVAVEVSEKRRGRVVAHSVVLVNGRRVTVQARRMPFATSSR